MPALVSRGSRRRTINEINMVPFIDVMLVLLIIFMVTAPMLRPGALELPTVQKVGSQPAAALVVALDKNSQLALQDKTGSTALAPSQLEAALRQRVAINPEQAVIIKADKNLSYDNVVQIMDKVRQAGVKRVGLSTLPKS